MKPLRGQTIISVVVIFAVVLFSTSCSVYMASNQPTKKDTSLFTVGMPRNALLAQFGNPISSEIKDGEKCDVFKFTQGYSSGNKVGRALFHGGADILTCGLWEFIGTPTEATFTGEELCYEVHYDANDKIKQVIALKQPK